MTRDTESRPPTTREPALAHGPPSRRWRVAAATWSALATLLGLWWCLRPEHSPFQPGDDGFTTALRLVPPAVAGAVLVVSGLSGLVIACLGRGIPPVAAAHVLVFGLVAPGQAPIAMAGCAMAMLGPWVAVVTVLVGALRWWKGWIVLGVCAAAVVAAAATGLVDRDVLGRYAAVVVGSAGELGPPALSMFLLLGGITWGMAGFGHRVPRAFALRWHRVAAWTAAACVLPYGLLRMTWLTPWPVGGDPAMLAAEPEMRLHGLLLGLAALAGGALSLGLVSRWGEVWPRVVPVLRGRAVPVAAAAVPGATVAALVTSAAPTTVAQAATSGDWSGLLIFPFWLWGPALGVAVLGYVVRRRAS